MEELPASLAVGERLPIKRSGAVTHAFGHTVISSPLVQF
jgi:hypothetical protein